MPQTRIGGSNDEPMMEGSAMGTGLGFGAELGQVPAGRPSAEAPAGAEGAANTLPLLRMVQTTFGDPNDPDYVFDIAPSPVLPIVAASISTNSIKLYSSDLAEFRGELRGHVSTISSVGFADASAPHLLVSSSADGTIRGWDVRSSQQVMSLPASISGEEVECFALGGASGSLLAAGVGPQVAFWDWRTMGRVALLEEAHSEAVTQLKFDPHDPSRLLSSSVDGLICAFSTAGNINDDDSMETVMSVGTSVSRIGFLNDGSRRIWCLTNVETMSLWDSVEAVRVADFPDTRAALTERWPCGQVDYLVTCQANGSGGCSLVAGSNDGHVGVFPLLEQRSGDPKVTSWSLLGASTLMQGGHTSTVRSVLPIALNDAQRMFAISGGEDGRLCLWSANGAATYSGQRKVGAGGPLEGEAHFGKRAAPY